MKNKKIIVIAIAITLTGIFISCAARANDKDTTIKNIAILPFTISIDTNNLPNGITENGIIRKSDINRYRYQRALHTWFIKKPRNYNVAFQDIITTNDLLKNSGFDNSIDLQTKQKLCTALGVDEILFGNVHIIMPRQKVSSEVMKNIIGIDLSSENQIKLELFLYNSAGNMLWKQTYDNYYGGMPDDVITRFMRRASKTIPFNK